MKDVVHQQAVEACQYLHDQVPVELQKPAIGIICGSGLGGLANVVLPQPRQTICYKDIPHFPASTGILDPYSQSISPLIKFQQCTAMRDSLFSVS